MAHKACPLPPSASATKVASSQTTCTSSVFTEQQIPVRHLIRKNTFLILSVLIMFAVEWNEFLIGENFGGRTK
jgi:hypothetical protein